MMRNYSAFFILIIALFSLVLMPMSSVQAATLIVSAGGTQTDSANGDAVCSLIDAIQVANGSATDSDCGVGDAGPDTILLAGGTTYNIVISNNNTDGDNGLPSITTPITIEGNGAVISRSGVSNYRLFHTAAGGDLTINDVEISGGQSASPGGGVFNQGSLTINRSTFVGNSSTGNGGGILVNSGNVTITNSTISSNSAASGGGIYVNGGTVNLNAVTIANNGGGIVRAGGTVNVQSTLLDNNGTNCSGTIGNSGSNLSSDATCSGFTSSGSINLGGLNLNAPGLTSTHLPGAGSSAIDTASSCSTSSDQRGVGRPAGTNCDIGSVEVGSPGFTIDEGDGVNVDEEGPTSDSYVVTVNTPPTSTVDFTITTDTQCEITSQNPVPVSPSTVGFTVNVSAIDDDLAESSPHSCTINHTATSADPLYNNVTIADVTVNVTDNDIPDVIVDPVAIDINEDGTTATYSISLATQPTSDVNFVVDPDSQCNVDTLAPSFNDTNWNIPQQIVVTAVNDLVDEGIHQCIITHSTSSADSNYDGITVEDVTATITDNDTAGVDVDPTTITLTEGGASQTYELSLDTEPADIVTINFLTPSGECTILSDNPLEISQGDTGPFTVEVEAVDDSEVDTDNCVISHVATSPDGPYDGISIPDVTATINDNDSPGLAYNPNPRSVTEGGPSQDYDIFLNTVPSADVIINIATDAQCAITAGNPATISNGTLGPATVTITAVDDGAMEASPHACVVTHTVSSGDINYDGIIDTSFTVDVTDNDSASISINDVAVAETNAGQTTATFAVTLNTASLQTVTVDWATADSTATVADNDYAANSGTVTFAPGVTSQPVVITVNGDTAFEGNDAFFVNLTNATNATISDPQGVGTITNDDSQPEINIDTPLALGEGDSGTTPLNFTVSLTNASSQTITVTWQTADNTAAAGSDYSAGGPTVLTFAPGGSLTQTVAVPIIGDTIDEPDETFFVNLSGATNTTIDVGQGVGTITDDDPQPTISINSPPGVLEGDSGTTPVNFTVSLSNASSQTITVNWTTADGSATTADSDYNGVASPTIITFNPGDLTQPISVDIIGDSTPESDETFVVNLATPSNASIGTGQGTGTILDDDTVPLPTLSIDDPPAVVEGTGGSVSISFTVTLSATSAQTVTVDWTTADNTAVAGSDYTAVTTPQTLTFAPGDLTQTATVQLNTDSLDEANETFFVNLATPVNATILDGQGIGTITDDDAPPTVSIDSPLAVTEGTPITFTATLSTASGQTVTVNWTTADNTAVGGSDYTAVTTPQTVTFAPGVVTQTLTAVATTDDVIDELDETFFVNLASPTNATINVGQGTGTITDNDAAPGITINDPNMAEGDSGTANLAFTVTLSNPSSQTVTVSWTTADGTAMTADSDYVGIASPTVLTFAPGVTTQPLNVVINGDTAIEPDEDFTVNLASPTNATITDATGVGTILNDDALPTLSIGPATVTEGNSGQVAAIFSVSLSAAIPQVVTVNWATNDGSAITADNDYAPASGTVTFPANDTTPQTITVQVNGDLTVEPDETFTVDLNTPNNATILVGQGIGTITNDDAPLPTLSISDATVTEGNSGQVAATFNVTLSAATTQVVTVNWATADNTAAVVDNDYAAASGTVTFPANSTTPQTITIQVNGDLNVEPTETFNVTLNTPDNATIADGTATGTITNDDVAITLSIGDVTVTEGNSGQVAAIFNVTLSAATPQIVTVNWATANNTATIANNDYAAASGTLTFPANSTAAQTITVQVNGDTAVEPSETFFVNLSGAASATILDSQGVGTIVNDDGAILPSLRISNGSAAEGNSGQTQITFSVSISAATAQVVTVNWATGDGSARVSNSDYAAGSGSVTFPANTTAAQTITVQVNGDTAVESDETFSVTLSNATNATLADAQGVGTILNDDGTTGPPTLRIGDISAAEGNSGTTSFNFTIIRTGSLAGTSTVTAATADGTATIGNLDYVPTAQTIQFPAGANQRTFTVVVIGDSTTEPNETFLVNLGNVSNGTTISDNQATGTIINDDGTTPGTTPTATPIPAVPPAPLCADLNGTTNPIIRAQVPAGTVTNGNVFCRVLAQSGQFVAGSPPETVGNAQVLSLGVVHAVDVYALSGGSPIIAFNNPVTVCLQGTGSMVYLDATQAPRPPVILTGATSDGTYTCVNIPNAGTVVLVQSGGNLPGVSSGGGGSGGPSQDLSGCVVTPLMRLNLRSVPGLDGRVLGIVPEGIALGSSERTRRWFRVSFEGRTGWIFAAYVSNNGVCGE